MSRFLTNRKFWVLNLGFVLFFACLIIKTWEVALVISLGEIYFIMSMLVLRKTQEPMKELSSNRKIRQIDTLIIGDWCSLKKLSKHCDLSHTLIVIAPNRSEKASLLILEHLAARLDGNNVCIILPTKDNGEIGKYDIPYLSQLTKLEMGITEFDCKKMTILSPSDMLKILFASFRNLKTKTPTDEALIKYCERKDFKLTCLG